MTAQDYLQSKLRDLRQPLGVQPPTATDQLIDAIVRALLSKKFRKYSANPQMIDHIRSSVRLHIERQEPINVTFFNGGYKLWRLDESPEADWAELFAMLYYSNWLKPVCALYTPGVLFDFLMDDNILPKLNNLPLEDSLAYMRSCGQVLDFLKPYQPSNLTMTITPVSSLYASEQAFEASLQRNLEKVTAELPGGLPVLDEKKGATIEMNVRTTDEQLADPQWREKIARLETAYSITKSEPGYHKNRLDKILAFIQPLPGGTMLSLGTTKDSIMKFWVGVGALKRRNDSYRQLIVSWRQLQTMRFTTESIHLDGLEGKNFSCIRII